MIAPGSSWSCLLGTRQAGPAGVCRCCDRNRKGSFSRPAGWPICLPACLTLRGHLRRKMHPRHVGKQLAELWWQRYFRSLFGYANLRNPHVRLPKTSSPEPSSPASTAVTPHSTAPGAGAPGFDKDLRGTAQPLYEWDQVGQLPACPHSSQAT